MDFIKFTPPESEKAKKMTTKITDRDIKTRIFDLNIIVYFLKTTCNESEYDSRYTFAFTLKTVWIVPGFSTS